MGGRESLGKTPLYGAQLSEYQPQKYDSCFELKTKDKQIVMRASNVEEMHKWLNAILKQKIMMEELVNSIVIS